MTKICNRHVDDEGRLSHLVAANFGWNKNTLISYVADLNKIIQHFDFQNPNVTSDEDDAKAREWTKLYATKLSSTDIIQVKNSHFTKWKKKLDHFDVLFD